MAARFWVGGDGTWDNSSTAHWSTTSNGASGSAAPTSSDIVTLDGNGGAGTGLGGGPLITVNANVNASAVLLGTTGGNFIGSLDFAANNNSPTFGTFAFSGSGTRQLNMGNGTWTLTSLGSANVFDVTTATGLTLNCNSSTVLCSSASTGPRSFAGGGKTFNVVTVVDTGNGRSSFRFTTAITIGTLNLTAPLAISFGTNLTTTITNAFTWAGTAFNSGFLIANDATAANTQATISCASGTCSIDYAALHGIAFTGGATFNVTNSFSLGGNSGTNVFSGPGGSTGKFIGG